MNKNEYYQKALAYLQATFSDYTFEEFQAEQMAVKMIKVGDPSNNNTMFLNMPYEKSLATNFANWEKDLNDYYINLTSVQKNYDNASLESIQNTILPQIKVREQFGNVPGTGNKLQDLLTLRPFYANLVVAYVLDQPTGFRYIDKDLMKKWGIGDDQMHNIALQNLVNLPATVSGPKSIQNSDGTLSYYFESRDGYDAARVLLPKLHTFLKNMFKADYLVAIPNRDLLFATPMGSKEKLVGFAKDSFNKSSHPITSDILIYR